MVVTIRATMAAAIGATNGATMAATIGCTMVATIGTIMVATIGGILTCSEEIGSRLQTSYELIILVGNNGKVLRLTVEDWFTTADIKQMIEGKEGFLSAYSIRLVFATQQLENDRTLSYYHINKDSGITATLY